MVRAQAEKAPEAAVIARELVKHYRGQPVVRGVDLAVQPGECFGLLGPNGAGKSTTLRMILGLSPVTGGELRVLGRPMPDAARAVRGRIGVVPQEDNLDPDLTVRNNLRVYARYFGLRGAAGVAAALPVVYALPLTHAVELMRPLVAGQDAGAAWPHLAVLAGYTVAAYEGATYFMRRRLLV